MKSPLQRLRELVKILKNGDNLVEYEKTLINGFEIHAIWQPKIKCIFLMKDAADKKKVVYLEDSEVALDDKEYESGEILEMVYDLENML